MMAQDPSSSPLPLQAGAVAPASSFSSQASSSPFRLHRVSRTDAGSPDALSSPHRVTYPARLSAASPGKSAGPHAEFRRRQSRREADEREAARLQRQAVLRLLPRAEGRAASRGKRSGRARQIDVVRHARAEKEAAKKPKRRLAVWRSRPASWLLSASSTGGTPSASRELVYVSLSGVVIPKPLCFRVAAEEKRFFRARGISDRPDYSSALLHPETLPPFRERRLQALASSTEDNVVSASPRVPPLSSALSSASRSSSSSAGLSAGAGACDFATWCLPRSLIDALAARNIHALYPWQAECLSLALPFFGRSLAPPPPPSSAPAPVPSSASTPLGVASSAAPCDAVAARSSAASLRFAPMEAVAAEASEELGAQAKIAADRRTVDGATAEERRAEALLAGREDEASVLRRGEEEAHRRNARGGDEREGEGGGNKQRRSCPSSPSSCETVVADDEAGDACDAWRGDAHAEARGVEGGDARRFGGGRTREQSREGSLTGRSLIYCAPTSGGKSLVADLIMVLRCLFAGKRCLYIVPHVSLCREKTEFLHSILFPSLCLRVQAFNASAASASSWFAGIDIAVCTVEQANNIINRLLQHAAPIARAHRTALSRLLRGGEDALKLGGSDTDSAAEAQSLDAPSPAADRGEKPRGSRKLASLAGLLLEDIGVVVLDEFHTLGEKERGYLVELLLMKIMFLNLFLLQDIQVVAMSATLPCVHQLAQWLNADVFTTALRPLPLDYFLKCDGAVYRSAVTYPPSLSISPSVTTSPDSGSSSPRSSSSPARAAWSSSVCFHPEAAACTASSPPLSPRRSLPPPSRASFPTSPPVSMPSSSGLSSGSAAFFPPGSCSATAVARPLPLASPASSYSLSSSTSSSSDSSSSSASSSLCVASGPVLRPQLVRRLPETRHAISPLVLSSSAAASAALSQAVSFLLARGASVHTLTHEWVAQRALALLREHRRDKAQAERQKREKTDPAASRESMERGDADARAKGESAKDDPLRPPLSRQPLAKRGEDDAGEPDGEGDDPTKRARHGGDGAREELDRRGAAEGHPGACCQPPQEAQEPAQEENRASPMGTQSPSSLSSACAWCVSPSSPVSSRAAAASSWTSARAPAGAGRLLTDGEHLGYLVWEAVREEKSVILFCATKAWSAKSAGFLASRLPLYRLLAASKWLESPAAAARLEALSAGSSPLSASRSSRVSSAETLAGASSSAERLEELLVFAPSLFVAPALQEGREELIHLLRQAGGGRVCEVQERAVRQGVAYHHAGLDGPSRAAIEVAYHHGILHVLCATSTLAIGVNLPAERVIVRSPEIGREALDVARFRQMAGRAGRTGYTARGFNSLREHQAPEFCHAVCWLFSGEAFLFCSVEQLPACLSLISGVPTPAASPPTASTATADAAAPSRRRGEDVSRREAAPGGLPSARGIATLNELEGGKDRLQSQLEGLKLCRALLEAAETLLPLSLVLSAGLFAEIKRRVQGERPVEPGADLRRRNRAQESRNEAEAGAAETDEARGQVPLVARLFDIVRLCSLRGSQVRREHMEAEMKACVDYLHENYLLEAHETAASMFPGARVSPLSSESAQATRSAAREQAEPKVHEGGAQARLPGEAAGLARATGGAERQQGSNEDTRRDPSAAEGAAAAFRGPPQTPAATRERGGRPQTQQRAPRRFAAFLHDEFEQRSRTHASAVEEARAAQAARSAVKQPLAHAHGRPTRQGEDQQETPRNAGLLPPESGASVLPSASIAPVGQSGERAPVCFPADSSALCGRLANGSRTPTPSFASSVGAGSSSASSEASSACLVPAQHADTFPASSGHRPADVAPSSRNALSPVADSSFVPPRPRPQLPPPPSGSPASPSSRSSCSPPGSPASSDSSPPARSASSLRHMEELHRQCLLFCRDTQAVASALQKMPHLRSPVLLLRFFLHEEGLGALPGACRRAASLPSSSLSQSPSRLPAAAADKHSSASGARELASAASAAPIEGRDKTLLRGEAEAEGTKEEGDEAVHAVAEGSVALTGSPAARRPPERKASEGAKERPSAERPAEGSVPTAAALGEARLPTAFFLSRPAAAFPAHLRAAEAAPSSAEGTPPGTLSFGPQRDGQAPAGAAPAADRGAPSERDDAANGARAAAGTRRGIQPLSATLAQRASADFSLALSRTFRLPRLLLQKLQSAFSSAASRPSSAPAVSPPRRAALAARGALDEAAAPPSGASRGPAGGYGGEGAATRCSSPRRRPDSSDDANEEARGTVRSRERARETWNREPLESLKRWKSQTLVSCTYLGSAAVETGLNPWEALEAFADLYKAIHQGLQLRNDLHLLYLGGAPVAAQTNISWSAFLRVYDGLDLLSRKLADFLGISRAFLLRAARASGGGANRRETSLADALATGGATAAALALHDTHQLLFEDRVSFEGLQRAQALLCHRRFFVALQLLDVLARDMPVPLVAEKFGTSAASVQRTLSQAALFAATMAKFVASMPSQLAALSEVFSQLSEKLHLVSFSCWASPSHPRGAAAACPPSASAASGASASSHPFAAAFPLAPSVRGFAAARRPASASDAAPPSSGLLASCFAACSPPNALAPPPEILQLRARFAESLSLRQAAALVGAGLATPEAIAVAPVGRIFKALEETEAADLFFFEDQDAHRSDSSRTASRETVWRMHRLKLEARRLTAAGRIKMEAREILKNEIQKLEDEAYQQQVLASHHSGASRKAQAASFAASAHSLAPLAGRSGVRAQDENDSHDEAERGGSLARVSVRAGGSAAPQGDSRAHRGDGNSLPEPPAAAASSRAVVCERSAGDRRRSASLAQIRNPVFLQRGKRARYAGDSVAGAEGGNPRRRSGQSDDTSDDEDEDSEDDEDELEYEEDLCEEASTDESADESSSTDASDDERRVLAHSPAWQREPPPRFS
ncbi:hypothetical protein BESB_082850 [Besnoitia besnoiti]|uniref:DEAD/DEAH box helicase domain-containing protein n=1 Tax=Besnoitia besnoiti TaxID=94643 RepID=A0A2A9MAX4_BESBE|nr:hypothetical protein BESB_082850 [Besnoitia besnoiti]PFH33086.1 hypothetical protein BESB_082850 [Besnoitia besnoiti]